MQRFLLEFKNAFTQMRYTSHSLADIFTDKFDGYVFDAEKSFSLQWSEMLSRYQKDLTKSDVKNLTTFAYSLGNSDLDGELNVINMYIEILNFSISEAQNNINSKSKLYKTLGFSFGLAVCILLI